MNPHLLPPLVMAVISGVLAPTLLAKARWVQHAPRLAATAWTGLGIVFTGTAGVTLMQVLLPGDTGSHMLSLLAACRPWTGDGTDAGSMMLMMTAAAALPGAAMAKRVGSSWRRRARHASTLRLVGHRVRGIPAIVLDDDTPVAYCVPGRSPQVVVTSGALRTLSRPELTAVLAHEWAHIKGRHHIPVAAAQALGASFGFLPLARHIRNQVPLLMELAADDRALHCCSREDLATALYTMAAGRPPRQSLAAGGPSAPLRIRRLLNPQRPHCPVARGLLSLLVTASTAVPVLAACCLLPE